MGPKKEAPGIRELPLSMHMFSDLSDFARRDLSRLLVDDFLKRLRQPVRRVESVEALSVFSVQSQIPPDTLL